MVPWHVKPVCGRVIGKLWFDGTGLEGKAKLESERERTSFGQARHSYYTMNFGHKAVHCFCSGFLQDKLHSIHVISLQRMKGGTQDLGKKSKSSS